MNTIHAYRSIFLLAVVLLVLAAACGIPDMPSSTSPPATVVQITPTATEAEVGEQPTEALPEETAAAESTSEMSAVEIAPEDIYPESFADYPAIQVRLPAQFSGGYSLPVDLSQVEISESLEITPQQRRLLAQNGFVVAAPQPGKYQEFYQVYESVRYEYDVPLFATTDSVFHVYHLIFDKMLRDLEREYFIPNLEQLTTAMLEASQLQYRDLQGTPLEEAALRNLAFFAVAARLQELPAKLPPEAAILADDELALIETHSGQSDSPIWLPLAGSSEDGLIEDYTQYIPRGHYTRSDELKRYFKAMMWYGRLTYRLKSDLETRRALLLVHTLRKAQTQDGIPATELWESIYEPTVFIVGKADDLGYHEYGALSDRIFGSNPDPRDFANETLFARFKKATGELPPPQVNSMWVFIWEDPEQATKGFRFMGQRFTLDAYVFGQMIWRNVGTIDNPRGLPKGLDFFAAMGSDEALNLLDVMGETEYANFSTQMDKVRGEVAALEEDSWTQNLYWSWLYAFQPVIEPKGERYPPFMRTTAWTHKDLHAALGSWTELKHDTILYAKQVMAELGGGGFDEPLHGYVEPNPQAYARLKALAQMTYNGLQDRTILDPNTDINLKDLIALLDFLQRLSEQHLAGEEITMDDYWQLMYYGGQLESLTIAAADKDPEEGRPVLEDQKAALIADVATGPAGANLMVQEEAIGQPVPIYVVLPDGPYRVGLGAVFTYYEFMVTPDQRMTDESWQAMVEGGNAPPQPEWTSSFIAP